MGDKESKECRMTLLPNIFPVNSVFQTEVKLSKL